MSDIPLSGPSESTPRPNQTEDIDAVTIRGEEVARNMIYSDQMPEQGENPMSLEDQAKLLTQNTYVREQKKRWKKNEEFETRLHVAQSHDNLTGLLNLQGITSRIENMMEASNEREFGVLYIDLNGFKKINDELGHSVGDELLVAFGAELDAVLRHANGDMGDEIIQIHKAAAKEEGQVSNAVEAQTQAKTKDAIIDTDAARAGGDEFIAIINLRPRKTAEGENNAEPMSPRQRLQIVENRIREVAAKIAASDERFSNFAAAIGGAVWTGGSSEEILKEAEHQMRADKPENSR